jgi:hypothetical protein
MVFRSQQLHCSSRRIRASVAFCVHQLYLRTLISICVLAGTVAIQSRDQKTVKIHLCQYRVTYTSFLQTDNGKMLSEARSVRYTRQNAFLKRSNLVHFFCVAMFQTTTQHNILSKNIF